jgi:hypothetical protein
LEPVFGIDVYAIPFATEAGYQIYTTPHAHLLLLRLENMNDCAPQAMREFLNLDQFELLTTNTGEERETADLYRLFKTKPLPREYVDYTYSSRLARHFYTEVELAMFTQRWCQ